MPRVHEHSEWLMDELLDEEPGTANGGVGADKPGYHNSRKRNAEKWPGNYSIRYDFDKQGPDDLAAAYDWTFRDAQRRDYATIAKYMKRFRASGKDPNDPRLDGWREIYGQADGDTYVEGYDFHFDKEVTSDSSHLWHIHASEKRKYVASLRNKQNFLSVARGESVAQWRAAGGKAVWESDGDVKPSLPVTRPPIKHHAPGTPIAFPLSRGHWFGEDDGSNQSHSGLHGRVTKGKKDSDWIKIYVNQLDKRGWDVGKGHTWLGRYGNDGKFGNEVEKLVRAFQRDQRLVEDGKLGPKTWNAAFLNPVT